MSNKVAFVGRYTAQNRSMPEINTLRCVFTKGKRAIFFIGRVNCVLLNVSACCCLQKALRVFRRQRGTSEWRLHFVCMETAGNVWTIAVYNIYIWITALLNWREICLGEPETILIIIIWNKTSDISRPDSVPKTHVPLGQRVCILSGMLAVFLCYRYRLLRWHKRATPVCGFSDVTLA